MPGGVSKMFYLQHFSLDNPGLWADMMKIIDNAAFDHHINTSAVGYKMKGPIKDIQFVNGYPYCIHESTSVPVRMKSLHFQGGAKQLILSYKQLHDENHTGVAYVP